MIQLSSPVRVSILEAGLILCWSSGFIGGVLASETSSIFLVLFWRFLMTSLILLPFAARSLIQVSLKEMGWQALIGSLAMFGYLITLISAIDYGVPAGTAALIAALQPLATATFAGIFCNENVVARQWLGLMIGFAGVAVAVSSGLGVAPLWAYGLTMISMGCIVAATLIAKSRFKPPSIVPTLFVQSAISAALFLPFALSHGVLNPELTFEFTSAVIWFIVFSTFGAYGLYWLCLSRSSAIRVSSLIYLTPPVTSVWALVMFGEAITLGNVVGLIVCLAGFKLAE